MFKRRKTIEHLINDRPNSSIPCPEDCGLFIKRKKIKGHLAWKHSDKYTRCPKKCRAVILRDEIREHLKEVCPNFTFHCPAGCGESIMRREQERHQIDCPCCESTPCPNGCDVMLLRESLVDHLRNSCLELAKSRQISVTHPAMYEISCPFPKERLHMDIDRLCRKAPFPCPNRCGTTLKAKLLQKHIRICPNRMYRFTTEAPEREWDRTAMDNFVPCSEGCGVLVKTDEMNEHFRLTCRSINKSQRKTGK